MAENWVSVKLAACVDLLAGYPFKSAQFSDCPDDISLVKGENVAPGYIDWAIAKRWPAADWHALSKFQLQAGDVVVAMDRPWIPAGLKWAHVRENAPRALLVQRCSRLRSNTTALDQGYLRFVVGSPLFEGYVRPITTGVNVPHISGNQILEYEFRLPPVGVQRRIASILSAYDDLIENCQRRIRILEDMARGLYRGWFVHFRFPGADAVPRVDSPLGPIPRGWEVRKLSELARYISRGITPNYDEAGPTWVINQKCIRGQRLSLEPARRQIKAIPKDKLVQFGDVLINSTGVGTLGRVAQVLEALPGCTIDTHVTIARPAESVDLHFFGMSLLSLQEHFERLGVGATGQTELSRTAIGELELPVAGHDLQNSFGGAVGPMREHCVTLALKITNLRRTRDLLLPRLLSGQIALPATEAAAPA